MTIEIHESISCPALFNALIEKIKQDFYIVHIHGNNMGGTTPFHFRNAPELTFLNKRFFSSPPSSSSSEIPGPAFDNPILTRGCPSSHSNSSQSMIGSDYT